MKTESLALQIEELFEAKTLPSDALSLVEKVIDQLDKGSITVVEKKADEWQVNAWVKKAILLYFRLRPIEQMQDGPFFDKIPLKTELLSSTRLVPFSSARKGSYIAPGVIVMAPSFINIGAYVDEGSLVDSLVLVGSCARVGKKVHIGAGTVIGGVLEPPNQKPVIIEDGAFIGGNCGIYEGCFVGTNAVIAAGTIITSSTPIVDIQSGEQFFGQVPNNAVVVPGGRKKSTAMGEYILQTPLIVKRRDPSTSAKLALEESLRSFIQSS